MTVSTKRLWASVPPLVKGGFACGLAGGLAVGAMVSPLGVFIGSSLGIAVGIAAGLVMDREERRDAARTKHLDEIIGVTGESLGTPPGSIPPRDLARDPEASQELAAWASEWLTPPPPRAT